MSDGAGWLIKGGTDLFEFEHKIGDLTLDGAEDQYHTLAGLLLAYTSSSRPSENASSSATSW